MEKIIELYYKLLDRYGPQHWWPADTPYEIIIGAILTQNTAWTNVEKALANLKPYLDPQKILSIDINELQSLIRPAGFYKRKANTIREITKWYINFKDKDTETLRKELLSIKGIGRETADSILLYAFNKLIFVVDEYTRRFCSYYQLYKGNTYEEYRYFFERNLPKDITIYKEYHALIVKWGKTNRLSVAKKAIQKA